MLPLLRSALGNPSATFHPGQYEAIEAVALQRKRSLVVERTGWGKSMVYFLATRHLRDQGAGVTLVVSPLLALMRNQVEAATRLGLRAVTYNSVSMKTDLDRFGVQQRLQRNEVDLLLVTPESLFADHFNTFVRPFTRFGLLVIDEAHCISDWGHDFRTDYRRLVTFVRQLPPNTPVLATTATANDRVVKDIQEQLGAGLRVQRGPLQRETLTLQNLHLAHQSERLAWLATYLPQIPGSGIVYVRTQRDAERVADWLKACGMTAAAYHAGVDGDDASGPSREMLEQQLLRNELKALVATSALGMGFDKPDLGFVVHFQRPGSVVEYYQQVGRAGRGIPNAFGVLMNGTEDDDITRYFIENAFPPHQHVETILQELDRQPGPMSTRDLGQIINLSEAKIRHALEYLLSHSPSPVVKEKSKWSRTAVRFTHDRAHIEAIKALRYAEDEELKAYARATDCLQQRLAQSLNDPAAKPCGRCASCAPSRALPSAVEPAMVQRALEFVASRSLELPPRKRWPTAALSPTGKMTIPDAHLAEKGLAHSIWGDGGWGDWVRHGKYQTGQFDARLLDAAAARIRSWNPQPFPKAIVCVPSRRHPELVPAAAKALAQRLGIPFLPLIEHRRDNKPQKEMQNAQYRVQNLRDAFALNGTVPAGWPLLLFDDIVDSGWTFTVLASMLRQFGSGPIFPFALAATFNRS